MNRPYSYLNWHILYIFQEREALLAQQELEERRRVQQEREDEARRLQEELESTRIAMEQSQAEMAEKLAQAQTHVRESVVEDNDDGGGYRKWNDSSRVNVFVFRYLLTISLIGAHYFQL